MKLLIGPVLDVAHVPPVEQPWLLKGFKEVSSCLLGSLLPVSEPVTGARPVPAGPLHDVRPEAPNVHPAIWPSTVPHGTEGLPHGSHARPQFSPHVWPDGSTAGLPIDENAASAGTQACGCAPQPAQHTTTAAPAPATVTTGTQCSETTLTPRRSDTTYWFLTLLQPLIWSFAAQIWVVQFSFRSTMSWFVFAQRALSASHGYIHFCKNVQKYCIVLTFSCFHLRLPYVRKCSTPIFSSYSVWSRTSDKLVFMRKVEIFLKIK